MSLSPEDFRDALAHWSSGVAVLTARWQERNYAMTVTSFSSVSLDPPLVLVCVGKRAGLHPPIAAGAAWAISVLAADQGDLARWFSSSGREYHTQFDGVVTVDAASSGAPVLAGCLVWLDCRTVARHDAGDHTIVVGEVAHTGTLSRTAEPAQKSPSPEPLTYYRRAFSDVWSPR
ncbi:MAG: flavin reductase family protein [Microlunatus sp.]|nr:flavin reductase family protein [Microlunatus sp.]MDN5770902.1 flavin reductase family protein [Microlunatus sp.]MDN5805295.1 flavin reductase family protein [Microlunatus sp.]